MPDSGNGSKIFGWLGQVPTVVWTVLITQFATVAVWAIRLDQRVVRVEEEMATVIREDTQPGKVMAEHLRLMEERQKYVINYLLFIREELARIAPPNRPVPPFNPPPFTGPGPQQK